MIVYILAIVGGILLLLLIIGLIAGEPEADDKEEKRTLYQKITNSDDPVKVFRKEQRGKLHELRKYAPSVMRNSVIMWLIQKLALLAIIGCILGVCYAVFSKDENLPMHRDVFLAVMLVSAVFFLLINVMAKMIRLRNKYIIRLEELID